jgi:MoxR-like ATPase
MSPAPGPRLQTEILDPMKQEFVGKDEIIDLLGVSLVSGENLFILGPPGTAKSALVLRLGERLGGAAFNYLLTRFTEPNELFGPFDIRRLREGELVTNTDGMLSQASLVFLDELLNANSAILNSLLSALNERVVPRGRERLPVRALAFIGASNHLPEDDALLALFDRFPLRVHCDNVEPAKLAQVLDAGWQLEQTPVGTATVTVDELRSEQARVRGVLLDAVRPDYTSLISRIRQAGITVSDRRAVKLQRVVAASALLCGREHARPCDLWVLRHIWHSEDQREVLRALVQEFVSKDAEPAQRHPGTGGAGAPDPEALARDLAWMEEKAGLPQDHAIVRDRLAILEGQLPWVADATHRETLSTKAKELWAKVGA